MSPRPTGVIEACWLKVRPRGDPDPAILVTGVYVVPTNTTALTLGAVISALVAEECNRVLGQELSEEEEIAHAGLVQTARDK